MSSFLIRINFKAYLKVKWWVGSYAGEGGLIGLELRGLEIIY